MGYLSPISGSFSITLHGGEQSRDKDLKETYQIDVIREFRSLILVKRMADIGIGSLHSHFASSRRDSSLLLRAQLDVELSNVEM